MKRTIKSMVAEAEEHNIRAEIKTNSVCFFPAAAGAQALAWMHKVGKGECNWTGFTSCPEVTGRKHGSKADVMNWCLDWAINGF